MNGTVFVNVPVPYRCRFEPVEKNVHNSLNDASFQQHKNGVSRFHIKKERLEYLVEFDLVRSERAAKVTG
jgi:hypothetical protein